MIFIFLRIHDSVKTLENFAIALHTHLLSFWNRDSHKAYNMPHII